MTLPPNDSHRPGGAEPADARPLPVRRTNDPLVTRSVAALGAAAARPGTAAGGLPLLGDEELTPALLLRILRRRWTVALPVLLAALGATAWWYGRQVPLYDAVATVRVDKAKEMVPGLTPTGAPQVQLGTEIQVLQSRGISTEVAAGTGFGVRVESPRLPQSAVVRALDPVGGALPGQYVLQVQPGRRVTLRGPGGGTAADSADGWLAADGLRLQVAERLLDSPPPDGRVLLRVLAPESAADLLRGALRVSQPVRDAQVLHIAVRDADPVLAARAANAAAEAYTTNQTRRRQAGGRSTVAFISSQLDTLERQLAEAESQLRDWRSAQKVVVPSAEAGGAVSRRAEYEERLVERKLELENIEALLGGALPSEPARSELVRRGFRSVLTSPIVRNNGGAGIISTLNELESRRAELRTRRTDADPDVQLIDRTISDYERQGQLYVASYVKALRMEISGTEKALTRVGQQLERFPGQELELATLQRNAEVLTALQSTLRTRLKEAEITNASTEPTSELLDRALPPGAPVSPQLRNFLFGGLGAGLALALLVAVIRDRMDRTVHSREDIEQATGVPLLALVPSFAEGSLLQRLLPQRKRRRTRNALADTGEHRGVPRTAITAQGRAATVARHPDRVVAVHKPRHVSAEAYRMLRTNLRFAPADHPRHVLIVTSATPGDGKSTTALNYAATVAVQRKRVLLIDGDMRRGTAHQQLSVSRSPGLSEVLMGDVSAEIAVRAVQLAEGVTLDLLACGAAPPNPVELLGGSALSAVVLWARAHYDAVIIDTPPVNLFADGLLLAAAGDAVLLVGRAGKSHREEVAMAAQQVQAVQVPLAGVVLNDYDIRRDSHYGKTYYQYDRSYYKYYAAYEKGEA